MTPEQYRDIVARAPADEDMEGGHHHEGSDGHETAAGAMPSMPGMDGAGRAEAENAPHTHAKPPATTTISMEGMTANAVPDAEHAAKALHTALQKGDRQAVLALLAPEVVISEGGESQSLDQYAAGHLGEDIAFLKTAQIKPISVGSMPMGDTAMVGSRSEIRTSRNGKPMAILSNEMLTLKKTPKGWLITRIEWASDKLPE